ncbi:hypothetical protein [Micromonospora sp. CPCC 206061]|uniref:hypothetical protein n=1 Tax=Micromonospora sp. CPCC 206061 TaxID=3122410 RepID=UPI002FF23B15
MLSADPPRAESAEHFAVLRRVVRAEHRAVILISHRLAEITAATDRVTALRGGRVVHTGQAARDRAARTGAVDGGPRGRAHHRGRAYLLALLAMLSFSTSSRAPRALRTG